MIKGHAVIELKDESTGKIWRTEHDNMITNGLKYALTPWLGKYSYAGGDRSSQVMAEENTEDRKRNNRSIMNHLLGGIFLFQNQLEEDADNVDFPIENPLIGKASWDAYNGIDSYRGSYNTTESGLQEDGSYKHVWDFSTNQANGQISAVSLTTYIGGVCGDGYKEWNSVVENKANESPFINLGSLYISESFVACSCPPIVKISQNEICYIRDGYCLDYNNSYKDTHISITKKILMKKRKFPLSKVSPFYDFYNQYVTEDFEIDVPEEFAEYVKNITCKGETSENYLYIYAMKNVNIDSELILLRIRKLDYNTEVIRLVNNTPYAWSFSSGIQCTFTDDRVFVPYYKDAGFHMYMIKISENSVDEVDGEFTNRVQEIGGLLYCRRGDNKCINLNTLEKKEHPYFGASERYIEYYRADKIAPGIYLQTFKSTNSGSARYQAYVYLSANALMTINNLPSPVVKTASQSMKITYTIQETDTEI